MQFYVFIPQSVALQNCSTKYGHVYISDDAFERVLTELKPEERELLRVDGDGHICLKTPSREAYVECESSEVVDIVKGIQKLFQAQLVERMKVIKEAQEKLDEIKAKPEEYISKLHLKISWRVNEERLQDLCQKAQVDIQEYQETIDKALETAKLHWWDYIKSAVINQLASPGRHYIEVGGERADWAEIQTLSQKYNLAVEPIREIDDLFKQDERDEEREKEEEAEKAKESKKTWIDWCMEHGSEDLKWAIENNYPIGTQYQAEVINYLLPEETADYTLHRTVHEDHGLRRVPNKSSREAHKALSDRVEHISLLPPGTLVKVGQIHSVELYVDCECRGEDYCDQCDEDNEIKIKRTAIPVTVKALHVEHKVWYVIEEGE